MIKFEASVPFPNCFTKRYLSEPAGSMDTDNVTVTMYEWRERTYNMGIANSWADGRTMSLCNAAVQRLQQDTIY